MNGITQKQFNELLEKNCEGKFVQLDGETFYCIENYDRMADFFMTITSSSDVWNTLWSQGGLTAGRIDCDHAIFPYYTADKIADAKTYTGSYTAVLAAVKNDVYIWEPFTQNQVYNVKRNLYKNTTGSKVYFEEINEDLKLKFVYGWTSANKYGLVKYSNIEKLSDSSVSKVSVLDGCRNVLPACVDAAFQNSNSVLLDAYKKTDFDAESGLTVFSVSSVVTDKAEPSEGLFANVSYFTTEGKIIINENSVKDFLSGKEVCETAVMKGGRPSCYILKEIDFAKTSAEHWYQIFDTWLNTQKVQQLQRDLKAAAKADLEKKIVEDVQDNIKKLEELIYEADGDQDTGDQLASVHHKANVMFNIMRGGIFADNGDIQNADFVKFTEERNKALLPKVTKLLSDKKSVLTRGELAAIIEAEKNPQLSRLFLEYLPLVFSRRHGDPSRPWNRFSIKIADEKGKRVYNYEGNWRDIFQNWEALCMSYPEYTQNIIAKFLNAMTIDGFNPYRISREGIDWEVPDPTNPWSNIGYWNDHQIIYLQKLIELQYQLNPVDLIKNFNTKIYSTARVPYFLKEYKEILKNPRSTVIFDYDLNKKLREEAKEYGSDVKLYQTSENFGEDSVELSSMLTKLLQLMLAKLANFVPGGGIWLNTQRPEWNDANNALAGYGLSMVTLYYLYRMMEFTKKIISESAENEFNISEETAVFLEKMAELYKTSNPEALAVWNDEAAAKLRKAFVDKEGLLFEAERNSLYKNGHSKTEKMISKAQLLDFIASFENHLECSIRINEREDKLYHAYNTLQIFEDKMEVSPLSLMLEGQVAVISSGYLTCSQIVELTKVLKNSDLYVADRNTYILYPNKELPLFWQKNNFAFEEVKNSPALCKMLEDGDNRIMSKDGDVCHFNSTFRNAEVLKDAINKILSKNPDALSCSEICLIEKVYEKTFNHQSFTGRSGTFFAYEGLGSVYWHMVAKLMLAVQEYILRADNAEEKTALVDAYYAIRGGIGFNKTPDVYGAFPTDPYSHTPMGQGAKQPGMTGQVKEEIITRWSELGIEIKDGKLSFKPTFLQKKEFKADGTLNFTRFGIPFTYVAISSDCQADEKIEVESEKGVATVSGTVLDEETSKELLARSKNLKSVKVYMQV